jgi:hypothetical protein
LIEGGFVIRSAISFFNASLFLAESSLSSNACVMI